MRNLWMISVVGSRYVLQRLGEDSFTEYATFDEALRQEAAERRYDRIIALRSDSDTMQRALS